MKRVSSCSHWGPFNVLVENDRIVGVEPLELDPAPSPLLKSVVEWAKPERRVLTPMVRSGWLERRENSDRSGRGREKFVPLSWDEATDLVAGELRRVRDNFGPASIFAGSYGWTSCGRLHHASSLLRRMMNLFGGYTGHVDSYSVGAGLAILRHTLGDADIALGLATTMDSIGEHTETFLVFGSLSPRTAISVDGGVGIDFIEKHLRKLVSRGAKVILISPVKHDVPDWLDAEWWPIRPNTDAALMLGLCGELLRNNKQDDAFLARCTSGSDRLLRYLRGDDDGISKDAAWASQITGLDEDAIGKLSRQVVASRTMLSVSWSLQRAHHGEQPYWAGLALAAMLGQIGLPGGGIGFGYGGLAWGAPISFAKSPSVSQLARPIENFIPVARIADMLLNPGAPFSYSGETYTYPDTRLVYWAGGNPFHHHQDLNRLAEAWSRPETIIIQDPMFTPTVQRADIILPANTSLERNDLAGTKIADFVFAMHQAIPSLGDSRSDFEIFDKIAAKLGVGNDFNEGRDEMGWLRHLYDITRRDAAQRFDHDMPDFDTFWTQGYARVPKEANRVYLADFREDPGSFPLNTESGKIVLGSEMLASLEYDDCRAHPAWIEPAEWLGKSDGTLFHLISNQPAGRLHSQLETGEASLAMKRNGREQVSINSEDAAALGIQSGDLVRLWNERGSCLATAELTSSIRRDVVVLPTGAWFTPHVEQGVELAGNPNVLTLDIGSSQFGQGCSAFTCLVRVEKFNGDASDALRAYQASLDALTK